MAREKCKELDCLCTNVETTELLLQGLHALEEELCKYHLANMSTERMRPLEGNSNDQMISFSLPVDKAKRSTQQTYKRK